MANAQAKQKGLKNEHSLVRPLEIQLGFSCNGNEESVVVLRYILYFFQPMTLQHLIFDWIAVVWFVERSSEGQNFHYAHVQRCAGKPPGSSFSDPDKI